MKILKSSQVRELDTYTIQSGSVSSWELMERASRAFSQWLLGKFDGREPFHVFCGKGNNGGDGLAIARILCQRGYTVKVYILQHRDLSSPDFETNEKKLRNHLTPVYIRSADEIKTPESGVIIDALLGSGLNAAARGLLADAIVRINTFGLPVVSVDIASGLFDDRANAPEDVIVRPDYTVAFQSPRLCFVVPQCYPFVGEWHVVDIGLSTSFLEGLSSEYYLTTRENLPHLLKKRGKYSHKGTFGHALLIAGSYGKVGAAQLAAKASLRSGAGLLTAFVPRCGYEIMQVSVPEAMVLSDRESELLTSVPPLEGYSAIGVGPGIGMDSRTLTALLELLRSNTAPLVLDADALNLVAANPGLLSLLKENTILTPHPKEFQRLAGPSPDDFSLIAKAQQFAEKYRVIICLKGAHTAVVLPDRSVYFNTNGNPGMATAGSGDVLTGIILGLLAQGYSPDIAARLAVFKHGEAGDRAAEKRSGVAVIASDLIENLSW